MPRSAATAMLKVFVLLLVSTLGLAARQSKPATHVEVVSHDTASNTSFVAPYYRNVTIEEAWVLPRSNTLRQEMCDCPGTTNTCCPFGSDDQLFCAPANATCCGTTYCLEGEICCGGSCCFDFTVCASSGGFSACCPLGMTCEAPVTCLDSSSPACGNQLSMPVSCCPKDVQYCRSFLPYGLGCFEYATEMVYMASPTPTSSSVLAPTTVSHRASTTTVHDVTQAWADTLQIFEIGPSEFSLEALSTTETSLTSSVDLNDFTQVTATWAYEPLPSLGQPTTTTEPTSILTAVNSPKVSSPPNMTLTSPSTATTANASTLESFTVTRPASAPVPVLSTTGNVLPNGLTYGIVDTPTSSPSTTTPAPSTLCFNTELKKNLPCTMTGAVSPQHTTSNAVSTLKGMKGHHFAHVLPLFVFSACFYGYVDADDWFMVVSLIVWCCQIKIANNIFRFIKWTNREWWGVVYAILIALTFKPILLGAEVGFEVLLLLYAFLQCLYWLGVFLETTLGWMGVRGEAIWAQVEAMLWEAFGAD
ncbi:MAG: hypothetical protein MMC33_005266 [Icmadophila ericetorum]|nr:hypothetical protein [Icmadophila ericetorum]